MRLKSMDGPLSVHNGNNDILNSPKRINTIQNSNITSNNCTTNNTNLTINLTTDNEVIKTGITTGLTDEVAILNNINNSEVQWCTPTKKLTANNTNNANNRLFNINNTLAVSLRSNSRHGTASSVCSESSPDDSLLDYEDAHQSCSSVDVSPQEEDRGFDISDSESLSEEVNLRPEETYHVHPRRGIVNPNYPGFQHLAHTLTEYSIKTTTSDTDDDEYDTSITKVVVAAEDNIVNNNNNEEDTINDKIDSVNRLDSVENIQKVFYDKPVFNIPCEDVLQVVNCDSDDASASNSNPICSDDDEVNPNILLNIQTDEKRIETDKIVESISCGDIIGDFGKEVEREFGRISRDHSIDNSSSEDSSLEKAEAFIERVFEPIFVERAVELELELAVEKLSVSDLSPSAIKCNIEPNIEQPFNKAKFIEKPILQDSIVVVPKMASISLSNFAGSFDKPDDNLNMKLSDAFLSSVHETIEPELFKMDVANSVDNKIKSDDNYAMDVDPQIDIKSTDLLRRDSNLDAVVKDVCITKEHILLSDTAFKTETGTSPKIMFAKENMLAKEHVFPKDSTLPKETLFAKESMFSKENLLSKDSLLLKEKLVKSEDIEKFCKEDKTKDEKEKDDDSAVPRKKEKMEIGYVKKRRDYNQQIGSLISIPRRDIAGRNRDPLNRRSLPLTREKKRQSAEALGSFDVYNIETAMPKIDLEAIEAHLRAAREEERRRRTDREEIRRRLAMGNEDDYYSNCDRPGRKPSLQARLQSGMNLQICFMNETVSDTESPNSDSEHSLCGNPKQTKTSPKFTKPVETVKAAPTRPATLSIGKAPQLLNSAPITETDFFTRQARLQTEARMALAQAKEMARMQMEIERQRQKKSPITEMVRHSLEKVGIPFPEDRRRLSRQILTEMNVAQLQVIVNDLHTQIEILNENLVKFLMDRDDLHMEQDSMLVDIEDLTRFLGAKEHTVKDGKSLPPQNNNMAPPSPAPPSPLAALNSSVKPHLHRIASFVKK